MTFSSNITTGDHSKQDQILLVKIAKHIDVWVYRRSWPPVIIVSLYV